MKKAKKLSLIILAMMFALSVALLSACAPTKYEIQLDDGLGNANSVQTTEINKDEEFTLPQMTQSKTGYEFDGWKRGSDGTVFNADETEQWRSISESPPLPRKVCCLQSRTPTRR